MRAARYRGFSGRICLHLYNPIICQTMKEFTYHDSEVKLNYIEGPINGSPLLLVHGNMGRWQSFTPVLENLMQEHHLYAVDLRGHGKSSRVANSYILQNHVLDMVSFIKNQIAKPVKIFGLSLGGMIGLMIAANHPELVTSLVIGDSPLTLETLKPIIESQKEFGHALLKLLQKNQIAELYELVNDDLSAASIALCDPDIITITLDKCEEMIAGYDIREILPRIKCPILIIRGEPSLGSMISDADMDIVRNLLPTMTEIQLPGIGHSVLLEREMMLPSIQQFL
jgi:pimeloyl-ACP methyl ester carboxylesterase